MMRRRGQNKLSLVNVVVGDDSREWDLQVGVVLSLEEDDKKVFL